MTDPLILKVRKHAITHITTSGDSHSWCGALIIDPTVAVVEYTAPVTCSKCLRSRERGLAHR